MSKAQREEAKMRFEQVGQGERWSAEAEEYIPRTAAEVVVFLEHAFVYVYRMRRKRTEQTYYSAWRILFNAQAQAISDPDPMLDKEAQ